MPRIRPGLLRKPLGLLLWAAAAIFIAALALPLLVERFFLPPLLAGTDFAGQQVRVSRFGISGCTLHISGLPSASPVIAGGFVRIDWTVGGLLRRQVDEVASTGLLVHVDRLVGRKSTSPPFPSAPTAAPEPKALPFAVVRIRIADSFMVFGRGHATRVIPVALAADLQASGPDTVPDPLRYRGTLVLGGQEMRGDFAYTHPQGSLTGRLEGEMDLQALAAMAPGDVTSAGRTAGRAEISARFALGTTPFVVDRIDAGVRLRGFSWYDPDMRLAIGAGEGGSLTVAGGRAAYRIDLAGMVFSGPVRAEVEAEADIAVAADEIGWQGKMVIIPGVGEWGGGWFMDEAAALRLRHHGIIDKDGVQAGLQTEPGGERQAAYSGHLGENSFRAAVVAAEADLEFGRAGAGGGLKAEVAAEVADFIGEFPDGSVHLPAAAVRASAVHSAEGRSVEGWFSAGDGGIALPARDIRIQGIHLSLPFFLPEPAEAAAGDFRIDDMFFRQVRLGGLTATLEQRGRDFLLAGELNSPVLPDSPVRLATRAAISPDQAPFLELSGVVAEAGFDLHSLAALHPQLEEISGSGSLDLAADLAVDRCGVHGTLAVSLRDGRFEIPEAEVSLHDTAFTFALPALPRLESAPAQKLTFGTIRGKKAVLHDVTVAFQVESPESLFIEQISGKWSGGRVFTSGFRLRPDMREVEAALICDRLELAQILSQLGLAEAEGEGRMSGRIPILYSNQTIFVDDGFLFTTPGEKGNLRIRQSEYLETDVPRDAVRLTPLHFAGAALGNFEYNWAKLYVNSEEENLLLMLQIDGKPKEKLPFRFDADRNMFVTLQEGETGGMDQPIKLDVNFRVPVNELFLYHSQLIPFLLQSK
ncbi:MAG TPA: hypothetical protein ENN06_10965 [Desulfobacteraceae bacterium]|nr:hypothetical protein [Desulfobacteraceae bacterium]